MRKRQVDESEIPVATTTQQQPVLGTTGPGERVPLVAWPTVALYVGTLGLFARGDVRRACGRLVAVDHRSRSAPRSRS